MFNAAPVDDSPKDPGNVTNLLIEWSDGDRSALERLTPIIYDDLLRLAKSRLNREYREGTLEPAALVHESYLRLIDQTKLHCVSRAHFLAIAANIMRRVLIDHARKRKAQKRGAGVRITLKTGMDFTEGRDADSLALDDALRKLAELDERKSRAIELKFFWRDDHGRDRSSSRDFSGNGGTRASPWTSLASARNVLPIGVED